jgi:hypothetical protein
MEFFSSHSSICACKFRASSRHSTSLNLITAQSLFICRANSAGDKPDTAHCANFPTLLIVIFRNFIAQTLKNRLYSLGTLVAVFK